jgi:hypothetical protein
MRARRAIVKARSRCDGATIGSSSISTRWFACGDRTFRSHAWDYGDGVGGAPSGIDAPLNGVVNALFRR